MVIEKQFVSFLIDRISVKLGDIRKQTSGETTQITVDETKIFVDQLSEALDTILSMESPKHEYPPAGETTPAGNRGGRRRGGESA